MQRSVDYVGSYPLFLGWQATRVKALKTNRRVPSNYKTSEAIAKWHAEEANRVASITDVPSAFALLSVTVMDKSGARLFHADATLRTPGTLEGVSRSFSDWLLDDYPKIGGYARDNNYDPVFVCRDGNVPFVILCHTLAASRAGGDEATRRHVASPLSYPAVDPTHVVLPDSAWRDLVDPWAVTGDMTTADLAQLGSELQATALIGFAQAYGLFYC